MTPSHARLARKSEREALTGVHTGRVLSLEIERNGMPTLLEEAEGNTTAGANASLVSIPRGRRPLARVEPSCARTGRSLRRLTLMGCQDASGRPEVESR